jgi:GTP-binding protein EngB required for normal cell division
MSKFKELYSKLVDAWVGQRIKDQENYPEHAHTFDQHFGVGSFASHLMGPLGGYEVRDLSEANVGSTYVITEMCEIQTLVDRGVLPGVEVTVTNRLDDMVMIEIPGSGYVALRGDTAKCVKVNKV